MCPAPASQRNRETRMIAASPRARLARLPLTERQLLLLLVSLGPEAARERLACLGTDRREVLAPLAAEVSDMPPEERRALFAELPAPHPSMRPNTRLLNARLCRERPRLASMLVRELAPRHAPSNLIQAQATDPDFARSLTAMARRWLAHARGGR